MRIIFEDRLNGIGVQHRDMMGHMATLATLAAMCEHCTEFGVRTGNSTVALLYGLSQRETPGWLASFDRDSHSLDFQTDRFAPNVGWNFYQLDTSELSEIAQTDLLLIDTLHTYAQVTAELKHAPSVRRWIVLHDTCVNWTEGEKGAEGIGRAVTEFLEANKNWRRAIAFNHSNGLTILERSWHPAELWQENLKKEKLRLGSP